MKKDSSFQKWGHTFDSLFINQQAQNNCRDKNNCFLLIQTYQSNKQKFQNNKPSFQNSLMEKKSLQIKIIVSILLLIYFIPLSLSTITLNTDITGPTGYSFTTVQINQDHIVHILHKNATAPIVSYFTPSNMSPINGTLWGITGNTTARIRTSKYNSNLTNPRQDLGFMYFTQAVLQISRSFTTTVYSQGQSILLTSVTVQQACFGNSAQQMFILLAETIILPLLTTVTYSVAMYDGSSYMGKVAFNQIDSKINAIDEFFFSDGYLFMLLTSSLRVYPFSNYAFGAAAFSQTFSKTPRQKLDIQVNNLIMTFSINNTLYQYDLTTGQYILSYTFPKTDIINSITQLPNSCYIIVKTNTTIIQFDECISQPIFRYSINSTMVAKVSSFGEMGFGIYVDTVGPYPNKYSLYNVTSLYPDNGTMHCFTDYTYDPYNLTCNRNSGTSNSSRQTSSNITFNSSTSIQNSSNPSTTPSTQPTDSSQNQGQYAAYVDQILPGKTSEVLGTALIVTSIKITPKFLLVFTLFLNDLWYYKYHQKNPFYPNSTKIFMDKVDLAKQFQLNTDFLINLMPFLQDQGNATDIYYKNAQFSDYLNFNSTGPDQVYFLYSTQQVYKNAVVMGLLTFFGLKILHLILYGLRDTHRIFRKAYLFIKYQTKWWTVLVGVIEANGVLLAFSCGLQMDLLAFATVLDKMNIVFMVLVLFVVILYASSFYWLVGLHQNMKCSETILVYTEVKPRSLRFEPLIILARSFIKSFFHSFFLKSYPTQIILLFVVDLVFLGLTLYIRKLYRNRGILLFLVMYFAGFAIFDLSFTLQEYGVIQFGSESDRELFGLILCCSLALLSILLSLSLLFENIYQLYKDLKVFIKKQMKRNTLNQKLQQNAQKSQSKQPDKQIKNHNRNQVRLNFYKKNNKVAPSDEIDQNKQNESWELGKYLAQLKQKDNIQFKSRNSTVIPNFPPNNHIKKKSNLTDRQSKLNMINQSIMKVKYNKSGFDPSVD